MKAYVVNQCIYVAVDNSKPNLPIKIGIAVCPRCRMVEYNNALRFMEKRHGNYEIVYHTKPFPEQEAKQIEKMAHSILSSFVSGIGGKETFNVSKNKAINTVRLATRRAM